MPAIDKLGALVGSIGSAVKGAVDTVIAILEHRQSEIAPAISAMRNSFQAILDGLVETRDLANDAIPIARQIEDAAREIASSVQTAFDLFANISQQGGDASIWDSLINMLSNPPKNLYYQAWNLGYGMALNIKAGLEDGLEIASPSKVLERIGMRMKEGLMIGWERPQQLPVQAVTHNVNHSSNLSVQFGDVNISDGQSAAEFEARVQQIMVRAIRGR